MTNEQIKPADCLSVNCCCGQAIHSVESLRPGDHLCCIYTDDEEHRLLLTPFLRQGLEKNERVVYIVDARTPEQILGYLEQDGFRTENALKSGQLVILSANDSYLRDGCFDPDKMLALLSQETDRAQDDGFSALRVTGEMSWALKGNEGAERLMEYEAKLNNFFPFNMALGLCQYDKRRFEPDVLLAVLETHPIAVIGTNFFDNFYYIQPGDFLGGHRESVELDMRIKNLRRYHDSLSDYKALFENTVSGFGLNELIYDDDGHPCDYRFLMINSAFEKLTGLKSEDVVGRKASEVFLDLEPLWMDALVRVALTGVPEHVEHFSKDVGKYFEVSVFSTQKGRFAVNFHDITLRVIADKKLSETAEKYKQAFENVQELIEIVGMSNPSIAPNKQDIIRKK